MTRFVIPQKPYLAVEFWNRGNIVPITEAVEMFSDHENFSEFDKTLWEAHNGK